MSNAVPTRWPASSTPALFYETTVVRLRRSSTWFASRRIAFCASA
jgi:hypothetical protein